MWVRVCTRVYVNKKNAIMLCSFFAFLFLSLVFFFFFFFVSRTTFHIKFIKSMHTYIYMCIRKYIHTYVCTFYVICVRVFVFNVYTLVNNTCASTAVDVRFVLYGKTKWKRKFYKYCFSFWLAHQRTRSRVHTYVYINARGRKNTFTIVNIIYYLLFFASQPEFALFCFLPKRRINKI